VDFVAPYLILLVIALAAGLVFRRSALAALTTVATWAAMFAGFLAFRAGDGEYDVMIELFVGVPSLAAGLVLVGLGRLVRYLAARRRRAEAAQGHVR
jgi:hypothetical protein